MTRSKGNPGAVGAAYAGADQSLAGNSVPSRVHLSPNVLAHIESLVASAPAFSPSQRALIASVLGGDR